MTYLDGTCFIHEGSGQKFVFNKGKWELLPKSGENFVHSALVPVYGMGQVIQEELPVNLLDKYAS